DAAAIEAADLVAAGVSERVAILHSPMEPAEAELIRRGILDANDSRRLEDVLRALGITAVQAIANPATGTQAESLLLPAWCDRQGFRSIIVVTTTDHSRRLRRAMRRAMRGRAVRVMVRPSRYSLFDPDRWWETRAGLRTEIGELQKLVLDIVL